MIPVVLIERIPAGVAASDAILDRTVDALLGMRGCDLRLVPRLPAIGEDLPTTMALEMISGPVILLGWHPPSQLLAAWDHAGLSGARTRHSLDADGPAPARAQRPVYAINLCDDHRVESLVETIQNLDRSANTSVATLSLGESSAAKPASAGLPIQAAPIQPGAVPGRDSAAATTNRSQPEPKSPKLATPTESQLDALVDDLDDFDL